MTAATASRIIAVHQARPADGPPGLSDAGWRAAEEVEIGLVPTPLESQPSAYVQRAWAGRKHGATPSVRAAAAVTGGVIHVRLRWKALNPRPAITDNTVFADACALMFPLDGVGADLTTMGAPARPVQAWHWRAGTPTPFVLRATGLGTAARQSAPHGVTAEAAWSADEWTVVFRRALAEPGVPFAAGAAVPIGIAVWQGALEERAGIASHTPAWLSLELPAQDRRP